MPLYYYIFIDNVGKFGDTIQTFFTVVAQLEVMGRAEAPLLFPQTKHRSNTKPSESIVFSGVLTLLRRLLKDAEQVSILCIVFTHRATLSMKK